MRTPVQFLYELSKYKAILHSRFFQGSYLWLLVVSSCFFFFFFGRDSKARKLEIFLKFFLLSFRYIMLEKSWDKHLSATGRSETEKSQALGSERSKFEDWFSHFLNAWSWVGILTSPSLGSFIWGREKKYFNPSKMVVARLKIMSLEIDKAKNQTQSRFIPHTRVSQLV